MNRSLLISILALSVGSATFAQGPTITSSVVPSIGSTSTFRTFDASSIAPGASDTGTTWDFSMVTTNGTNISDYKDPSNMQGSGPFTGANLGVSQGVDVQIYFKASATELSMIGTKYQTLTENYKNNPREALRFPIAHGIQFVDSFSGTAQLASFNADRSGDIAIVGDGYGTLILPYATFNNVLRVRAISTYEDVFLGNVVNEGTDTIYTWYKEGMQDYLFNWTHIDASMLGETFYGVFLDTMFVGIEDVNVSSGNTLKVYPNPASDYIYLSIETPISESLMLDIYNVSGKVVRTIKIQNGSAQNFEIYIGDLKKGLYSLQLKDGKSRRSAKILVK